MRLFLLSAVLTGAFSAALLHLGLPDGTAAVAQTVAAGELTAATISHGSLSLKPAEPLALGERLSLAYDYFTGHTPAAVATLPTGPSTHLLNEPVSILDTAASRWINLPKGTPVQMLSSEGSFARVRYAQSVVTVPRKVLVSGLSRIN